MSRATFSNLHSINQLVQTKETVAKTLYVPLNKEMDVYEAAELYKSNKISLIIIAGSNYGSGPSRDWSVKGQSLLVC